MCVGSCVHLVGASISFKKNFYRLPFTPPLSGSPYRSFNVVLDSVKNLLWDETLKHFTLLEGVEPANVKRWTLTRMATQFQKFKQQLDKDYIKKNRTPNWIEYPKLKEH
jgi:hypothetical protein